MFWNCLFHVLSSVLSSVLWGENLPEFSGPCYISSLKLFHSLLLGYCFAGFWMVFTCHNTIFDTLASLWVGHHFGGIKKTFWLDMLHAFFWSLWGERSRGFFVTLFPPSIIILLLLWSWFCLLLFFFFFSQSKAPFHSL